MMKERSAKKLTKAKSLFRDRKRFSCLIFLSAVISLDSRRGYSKASAR